jgi:hypothetical protein
MRSAKNTISLVVLMLLCFAADAQPQEADGRQRLVERKARLQDRIEELKREQDYLLFQKQMYASDSKYLLLDLAAGRGELRYRDRILKNFTFFVFRAGARKPPRGVLTLTAKKETEGRKRTLMFGAALVIETKQKTESRRKGGAALRLALLRKDMASLFYALDAGSLAYIIR